eukprot:12415186-Karenia_brevis.AAC.1
MEPMLRQRTAKRHAAQMHGCRNLRGLQKMRQEEDNSEVGTAQRHRRLRSSGVSSSRREMQP